MTNYHPIVAKIIERLKDNRMWFETFEHEPVRTSEEAARVRPEYTLNQGAKALILKVYGKTDADQFVMVVFPADLHFSSSKLRTALGTKKLRFATESEVSNITDGIKPGGVPPLGDLFNLEVITDPRLYDNKKIIFNAGDRSFSVGMLSSDFRHLLAQKIVDIT